MQRMSLRGKKKRAGLRQPAFPFRLEASDVRGLQTFRSASDLEFNRLAFVEGLVAFRLDRGKVHEDVLTRLALDESESLAGVEPFHCSLFSH